MTSPIVEALRGALGEAQVLTDPARLDERRHDYWMVSHLRDRGDAPAPRPACVARPRSVADVQATLREKLGVEEEPYLILGACNPPLAHQALSAEPDVGTLLPCNVVVYQRDGHTHISAIDAERMLSIVGNDDLAPVAAEVRAKLAAVVERVGSPASAAAHLTARASRGGK